jgi:hypothetical protein
LAPDTSLLCHRCGRPLTPGLGDFYVIRIEAVCDPAGPLITEEDLAADFDTRIRELLDRLESVSDREALDQVYRKLTIHLCLPCYEVWIEDPTGGTPTRPS